MIEYRRQERHRSPTEYRWLKHHIPSCPPGERRFCLDFGCGDHQAIGQVIKELGYHYVGIDYDPQVAPPIHCDGHHLPFEDSVFDLVYSGETLEHLHSPWLAIQEIGRVTKEGALFVGHVPQLYPFHGDSYFGFTFMGIQRLLELGDFQCDEVKLGYTLVESLLSAYIAPFKVPGFLCRLARVAFYATMNSRRWAARVYLRVFKNKLSDQTRQKIIRSLERQDLIWAGGLVFIAHKNSRMKKQ